MSSEVLEELDLAEGPLGQNLLAEDIGDFLYGNALAGLCVGSGTVGVARSAAGAERPGDRAPRRRHSPNNSVCSLAQLLGDGVALVDDKVLVEDLEGFAALEVGHGAGGVGGRLERQILVDSLGRLGAFALRGRAGSLASRELRARF